MRASAAIEQINAVFGTNARAEALERGLKIEELVASIEAPEKQSCLESIIGGTDEFFLARMVLEDIIEKTRGTYKAGKAFYYLPSKQKVSIDKVDRHGGTASKPLNQPVSPSEAEQFSEIPASSIAFASMDKGSFKVEWYIMEKGWRFLYSEELPPENYLSLIYPEAKNFIAGFSTPYYPTIINTSFLAVFDEPWEEGKIMEEREQEVSASSSYAVDVISLAEAYGKKAGWSANDFLAFILSEAEFKNRATMFKADFSKTFLSPFYSTNPLYQLTKLKVLEGREKAIELRKAAGLVRKWCSYLTLNGGVKQIKDGAMKALDISSVYVRLSGGLENTLRPYLSKSRPQFFMVDRKPHYQFISLLPGLASLEEGCGFIFESEKTAALVPEASKADFKIVAYYDGNRLKLMADNEVFSFRTEKINNNTAVIRDYER